MILGCAHCGHLQMVVEDAVSCGTITFSTMNCKRCKSRSRHTVSVLAGRPMVISKVLPRVSVDVLTASG